MGNGTQLGRVRGLGAAKSGAHHWWVHRLTAIANLVLVTWLVASLLMLPMHDFVSMTDWIKQPLVAVPLIILIVNVFHHLRAGLQVVIEDYIHQEGAKVAALVLLNAYVVAGAALGIFCVLKIAFGA